MGPKREALLNNVSSFGLIVRKRIWHRSCLMGSFNFGKHFMHLNISLFFFPQFQSLD